jgi:hypothetical protein
MKKQGMWDKAKDTIEIKENGIQLALKWRLWE